MPGLHPHEHLPLPLIVKSPKRNRQQRRLPAAEYAKNLDDRQGHGRRIRDQVESKVSHWQELLEQRAEAGLPDLEPGIPLILRTEEDTDIDFYRSAFAFEIVAELEGGYALVASGDNDLSTLQEKLNAFVAGERGANTVARIYEIVLDESTEDRLSRILSPKLFDWWPRIEDARTYPVHVSVSFGGNLKMPDVRAQQQDETDDHYADYLERRQVDSQAYYRELDDLQLARMDEVEALITAYGGTREGSFIQDIDSFSFLAALSGATIRDFVLTYKYLYRMSEPEQADSRAGTGIGGDNSSIQFEPPHGTAPQIAILDSGIQESHPYVGPAIDPDKSICLASGLNASEVGDNFGHGTRVAGAALFPEGLPAQGTRLPFHIVNVKVLDNSGRIADSQTGDKKTGGQYLGESIAHLASLDPPVRILNHSIANRWDGFHGPHMSPWASSIDRLSYQNDVLIVQAAGNIWLNEPKAPARSLTSLLASGKSYPDYLLDSSSRVSDPAQALHALSVGSVCFGEFCNQYHKSFGSEHHPSAFTTTGPGMWRTVKPDVVVPSGDFSRDFSDPPSVVVKEETSRLLPQSTMKGGPLVSADNVGTSFAAPMVAHLAARVEAEYPGLTMQHVRALIGLSARWPDWCSSADTNEKRNAIIRMIGFGIPDFDRAVSSADSSVTFISTQLESIGMREAHIYQIPLPEEIRELAYNKDIRIEVALAYIALPRPTRRQHRGYLSTWIDWTSIKMQGEAVDAFKDRVLNLASDENGSDIESDADDFPWFIRERSNWGQVANVSRNYGSLQKDWCVIRGIDLPDDLCFAVIGHAGWDKTGTHRANYALAVSIECADETVELYAPLQVAVESLRIRVQ